MTFVSQLYDLSLLVLFVSWAMRRMVLLLLFSGCLSAYAQKSIRPRVQLLADSIARYGKVESAFIGNGGQASEQYLRYKRLLKIADANELNQLTHHPSPTVRCYAVRAAGETNEHNTVRLLMQHARDTALVLYTAGDFTERITVRDYIANYFGLSVVDPAQIIDSTR